MTARNPALAPLPPSPSALGAGDVSEPVPTPESGLAVPFRRAPASPGAPISDAELRRIASRARRVRLLGLLLARGRPLTFGQIVWLTERDPSLSPHRLRADLLALLDLGLVTRCGGFGHRADYSPSLAAKRTLRP